MSPKTPADTSLLAGEDGRGGARRSTLPRKFRANPSPAEVRLWRILHGFRFDGFHFRRQVAIGSYVVDFACLHAGLVIEADGDSHGSDLARTNDATRDDYLTGRGFAVLRFSNYDIRSNGDGVFTAIAAALEGRTRNHRGARTPLPSSPARGEVSEAPSPHFSATLPLAGRAGEGGEARTDLDRGKARC